MASEIRVNQIQNRSGLTTTTFTDTGVTIAGILTVSENLNVGGVVTYEDVTNVDAIGIVTARAGINLVGNDLNVGSNIKIGNASGIVTATTLDISGNADIDGTLEADAYTVDGTALNEYIADTVGAMVSSNTESGITVAYVDGDNTLDFTVGTLNQNTTGTAGGLTGTPNISCGTIAGSTGTFTGDVDIADKIVHTGDTNTTIRFPANDTFSVETAGTERLRITSDGKLKIGTTATPTQSGALNVFGTDQVTSQISVRRGSGDAAGPRLHFQKSRNTTDGSHTVVQDDDVLGQIVFAGNDAGGPENGALISAEVDGSPGGNDMPARLVFSTTPDGSDTLAERLRIDSSGRALINTTTATGAAKLQLLQTSGDALLVRNHDTNYEGIILANASGEARVLATSGGSTARPALTFFTSDAERLRIDGNGKVGVGGAPSGWQAANTSKVIQIGNASIFNYNDAYFHVGQNFYYDGSNYKYVANGFSSRLIQNAGEFTFIQAASGSANANITWSDRLKIDTTGRITQNGTTSVDTGSALTLKNGHSSSDHTILEVISDPNQYSMIYMGASDDRHKGRIRYKDNDHFMDFYTNNEERMKLYSNGKVGINTDSTSVDAQVYIGADPGIPALYSAYGMRIMPNGNHDKRISNATGVYALTAGITADNSWHTVAIGRYHAATVTIRVGDASSKRSMFINYDLTAPNYGVAHYNIIANNGQWNTGGADFQIAGAGTYDYALQVRHNSYYNSSNNSGVYMIFNVC